MTKRSLDDVNNYSSSKKQKPNNEIVFDIFDDDDDDIMIKFKPPNNSNNSSNSSNSSISNNSKKPSKPTCPNPTCDHIFSQSKLDIAKNKPVLEIKTLLDLINLGKSYHCKNNETFHSVDLKILCNLVMPLTELDNLVGMADVKTAVINHIVFFLQGLNKRDRCNACVDCTYKLACKNAITTNNDDMLHTVITGPPGVGKTELGKILAKIYKAMGILSKGEMHIATRSDLIGKYLGHTAAQTQAFINKCAGSVMFIDEAYSLGNPEGKDSFSKECIDTLNQNLSEKRDFLCIIAGYKESLNTCFFSYNPGLERRFPFRYDIKKYSGVELSKIFILKIKKEGWFIDLDNKDLIGELEKLFTENIKYFANFGGDVETLFLNCKIVHGRRQMFKDPKMRKVLVLEDIKNGFELYKKNKLIVKEEMPDHVKMMFL